MNDYRLAVGSAGCPDMFNDWRPGNGAMLPGLTRAIGVGAVSCAAPGRTIRILMEPPGSWPSGGAHKLILEAHRFAADVVGQCRMNDALDLASLDALLGGDLEVDDRLGRG